jgi:hypothetical protein
MKMTKAQGALAVLASTAGITSFELAWSPPSAPSFRDVGELQAWASGHGLHSGSDRRDGKVASGVALSPRPLSWQDVGRLHKGAGRGWTGIVWAVNLTAGLRDTPQPPWDGECRVWGGVVVTGDPCLLDRIEQGMPTE